MSINIENLQVQSFSTSFLDINWELYLEESDSIVNYEFYVYRGGSERGPWEQIHTYPLVDTYSFRDYRVNLLKNNKYFYKLLIKNTETEEQEWFGPVTNQNQPDLLALEIARKYNLILKNFSGQRLYIFPIKKFGQRCGVCYDKKLGQRTVSECYNCFNTTFVGGYHRPIIVYAQLVEQGEQLIQTNMGDLEPKSASISLANYPLIEPRDLIVDSMNRRWRALSPIQTIKKLGYTVKQQFGAIQINPSDIEYKIPININNYNKFPAITDIYLRLNDYDPNHEEKTQLYWNQKIQEYLTNPQTVKNKTDEGNEYI